MHHDPSDAAPRRPFPIPVVSADPAGLPEDDGLDYIRMPQGMSTWQSPQLPEPEELQHHAPVIATLQRVRQALQQAVDGSDPTLISVSGLDAAARALLHQALGEGEVAVRVTTEATSAQTCLEAQETIYAGVWRVLRREDATVVDTIEIGAAPPSLVALLRNEPHRGAGLSPQSVQPAEVMNAPAILAELADHWTRRRRGEPAHVVNLTLLPLARADVAWLDHELGAGRVQILSRGYGNCRVTSTARPHTWRVIYYNSMDTVILDTIELVDLPEVALAAPEDLAASLERLTEAIEWMEGA